jgi:hypothetical protein
MYKLIEWNESLDLTSFYSEASKRGFHNNSSQKVMIDCFKNEREFNAWILYKDGSPIGSVAAHSFDDIMGKGSYRVLTRVCSFGDENPNQGLVTVKRLIKEHQNFTDQFFLPKCIEWTNTNEIYATSNDSNIASQRLVHKFYFPTLEKLGIVNRVKEIDYRGLIQTVWKINPDKFLENLNKYPRWQ